MNRKALEEKRVDLQAQMSSILDTAKAEKRALTEAEETEFTRCETEINNILEQMAQGNYSAIVEAVGDLVERGCDLYRALCDMQVALRKAMVESFKTGYFSFGQKQMSSEQIMRMLDVLQGAEKGLKSGLSEKANFEVALLKAVEESRVRAINTLIKELDKLSGASPEMQKKNNGSA